MLTPAYGGRCFADIPATVMRMLTGAGEGGLAADVLGPFAGPWDRVALVVVDAFGWKLAERHAEHPFLRRAAADGIVAKLTAQFPSTTAAHMTTVHTGLPVGASGIYEWFQYEPALDAVVAPLLFSFAGDGDRETLRAVGFDPRLLYPQGTVYGALATRGIRAYAVQDAAISETTFTRSMLSGATLLAVDPPDVWPGALSAALAAPPPVYAFAYVDAVDAAGHEDGPSSRRAAAAAAAVLDGLESLARAGTSGGRTLLLVTADHGQVDVDPATTVFVNVEWPEIVHHLRRGRDGRPLAPAGSARDLFLHVLPGHVDDIVAGLATLLDGRATVRPTDELVAAGILGDVGERMRARVGEVVVLPDMGGTVWWREPGRFDMRFRGHHGGLTPEEMEIALVALPLG